ncbi:MAG: family 43 glycosylhydrolase [Sedimentisphaerales bacterium]|nr:family 43 glycosylhydrolase [Sedimentisphaerales bacterium]
MNTQRQTSGNPIMPGIGLCDPHIRIYNDRAYLYATHDKSAQSERFIMEDWWIWSTPDLINWQHECTIRPEETYYAKPDTECWAVDAMERNGKHYFYFSRGPANIGVLEADTPIGPWRDPLGKPILAEGAVDTMIRDPGLFKDDDGTCYIVFGTMQFYIARLNEDMISLAETPRLITINNPEGPYGKGKMDDKPYLHKRDGIYYLSWGCYYGMSDSVYGDYDCRGSIVQKDRITPSLHYRGERNIDFDRHGSFFEWRGQWYFICNEMGRTQNVFFRDSSISYVNYLPNGRIEPVNITEEGVSLP